MVQKRRRNLVPVILNEVDRGLHRKKKNVEEVVLIVKIEKELVVKVKRNQSGKRRKRNEKKSVETVPKHG